MAEQVVETQITLLEVRIVTIHQHISSWDGWLKELKRMRASAVSRPIRSTADLEKNLASSDGKANLRDQAEIGQSNGSDRRSLGDDNPSADDSETNKPGADK